MSIVLRDLAYAYGRLPVLAGITAEASAGRVTALFGPNAAGKSTLLRCVIGALTPTAGEALIDGAPASHLRGAALARRVAYVAQRSTVAMPFTVREVVELGRYALGPDARRVDAALERLDLAGVADRPFPALSVGQQQRVALARAVAQLAPDGCLVLDEPTAAMDLSHARRTRRLLRALANEGAVVLIAMHDLAAGVALADDAWLLAPGPHGAAARLDAAGPVGEVMQPDRLRQVFHVEFEWVRRSDGGQVLLPEVLGGDGNSHPGPSAGR